MSINAAMGKFRRASKDLQILWSDASQYWRDENSRTFEEQQLEPLLARLRATEAVMSTMEEVLIKLRRDCSDPEDSRL